MAIRKFVIESHALLAFKINNFPSVIPLECQIYIHSEKRISSNRLVEIVDFWFAMGVDNMVG